jgi:hypothetical protein
MPDTAEAISRDTDVPVDWIRDSLEDVMRYEGLTPDLAYLEVRAAYEATFHAFAHRTVVAMGRAIRAARRRAVVPWSAGTPR